MTRVFGSLRFNNGVMLLTGSGVPTNGFAGVAGVTGANAADGSIYIDAGTGHAMYIKTGTGTKGSVWTSQNAW